MDHVILQFTALVTAQIPFVTALQRHLMQTAETFAQLKSSFDTCFSHIKFVTEIGNLGSDFEVEVRHVGKGIAERDSPPNCREVLTQSRSSRIKGQRQGDAGRIVTITVTGDHIVIESDFAIQHIPRTVALPYNTDLIKGLTGRGFQIVAVFDFAPTAVVVQIGSEQPFRFAGRIEIDISHTLERISQSRLHIKRFGLAIEVDIDRCRTDR